MADHISTKSREGAASWPPPVLGGTVGLTCESLQPIKVDGGNVTGCNSGVSAVLHPIFATGLCPFNL